MRFIHSNKQYIERTMYPINPYMNTPAVAPLTMEAFVAPANFDPDAQELNIVKAFAAYPDMNKKYIFSVGTSETTVLPAVTGRSYAYSENGGAYTTIPSGTVTWTVGSTKRNVVVIDSASSVIANIPVGGVWGYASYKVYSFYSFGNTFLKYMHCQILNSVISFSNNTFSGCPGLTGSLTIPSSVTSIGSNAFGGCSGLTGSLTIPSSVTSISNSAFSNCRGFTGSLTIPDSVTSIANYAFYICPGFTGSLTIPSSVTSIGDYAFDSCSKFTGSLTIPSSVTSIGVGTFWGCSGLTSITVPSSVTSIGGNAFRNCLGFTSITVQKISPITLSSSPFIGINKATCILHVPVGSLAAYQAAQYWNEFTNIIADL